MKRCSRLPGLLGTTTAFDDDGSIVVSAVQRRPFDLDDLRNFTDGERDRTHFEVIDGRLVLSARHGHRQARVVGRLLTLLTEGCRDDFDVSAGLYVTIPAAP